jgi:hypothetical protein
MKRPAAELTNFESVYRYYEAHDQSMAFARFAHLVFARAFRLDLSTGDGVEDAIRDALAAGTRLVVSPNHITGDDQYVIVSLAQTLGVLRPLRGNTFIPSEPSLFIRSGIAGKALRRSVDGLGALPTFRIEDLRRQGIERTPEIEELHHRCTVGASEAQVAKLTRGQHMAGFWEGTRNRTDYRVVQPLKKGMAHTAIAAAKAVKVAILPVGFYYGSEPADYKHPDVPGKRRPHVHVGMPIPVVTTDATELVALVQPAIQACVDVVVARAVANAGVPASSTAS